MIFKPQPGNWVVFLVAAFLLCDADAEAQSLEKQGYAIDITIAGLPDSVCYLANYYGDKTYLTDTALVEAGGRFAFTGDTLLPGGIYIVAGQQNNKYFELIIDKEQQFSLETSMQGIPHDMTFKHSDDNTLFYDYVGLNLKYRKEIESLKTRQQQSIGIKDSADMLGHRIDSLVHALSGLEEEVIRNHPGRFVSVILKARQEPKLEAPRYLPDGSEDSVYAYQRYKKNYWNNLDPSDDRLLRTPLYHIRLKNYFEQVIYQNPDTLSHEADLFIERASGNRETYKYAIWYLTYKFETSKVMGFDEIFVHMVDNYYAKGLAYWAEPSVVKSLQGRADELRNVLIGSQAPNMILLDTAGGFKALYGMEAGYTLVFFYETGCSHCRKEIAALSEWYPENPYDLRVFAVCTDTSLADWKQYIGEIGLDWVHVNGTRSITPDYHDLYDIRVTPTLYLLDDKKKIVAKRLKVDQLIPFLANYHARKED